MRLSATKPSGDVVNKHKVGRIDPAATFLLTNPPRNDRIKYRKTEVKMLNCFTVKELIDHLQTFPKDAEVMIIDGENGDGEPRNINLAPTSLVKITKAEAKKETDCEGKAGVKVVVLGFGCY